MNRKRILILGAIALAFILGLGVYIFASTWGGVQRVTIETPTASAEGESGGAEEQVSDESENSRDERDLPTSSDGVDVTVLVGSDSREGLEDTEGFGDFEGQRADVIMVMLRPEERGATPAILSIPRDLWVENVCGEGNHRINDALEGCETMSGPSSLVTTVESLIDIDVDHFTMIDLAGFQHAVDAVGGFEICLGLPVRDSRSNLELPGGCTLADGEQVLAWLRSRHTQELTADGWRTMTGVSDLTRNERQRDFLITLIGRIGDLSNPQDVVSIAQAVAPFVTVDDKLSLMNVVDLAAVFRSMDSDGVIELELPVTDHVAENGAAVLVATVSPSQVIEEFLVPTTAGESTVGDAG